MDLDDLDLPDPVRFDGLPEFDDDGMFAGAAGQAVWPQMLAWLEKRIDEAGWDQPVLLYPVFPPVATELALGEQLRDRVGAALGPDDAAIAWSLGAPLEIPGDPRRLLWGAQAPDGAAALVLSMESWAAPVGSGGRPSQSPDRREIRQVLMVTRSGQTFTVLRYRGEPPETHPGATGLDVTAALMAHALGASEATTAALMHRSRPAMPAGLWPVELVLSNACALVADPASGLDADLSAAWILENLLAFAAVAAPLVGVEPPQNGADRTDMSRFLAQTLCDMTWDDLLAIPQVLPEELRDPDNLAWAGTAFSAAFLTHTQSDLDATRARVESVCGQRAALVAASLADMLLDDGSDEADDTDGP